MPDEFIVVKRTGWGKNILTSFMAVLVGIVMFIASFVVLWNNEGRTNMGKVAEGSVILSAGSATSAAEGKLVSLTGPMDADAPVGDPEFLKTGKYIQLDRITEMYAWVEETETKEEKKVGGGTEEKTIYRYKKDWTSDPEESSDFKVPEGHANPYMAIKGQSFFAPVAKIGIYGFDPQSADLPDAQPVFLLTQNAILSHNGKLVAGEYIFVGKGSFDQPQVGDQRIGFEAVNAGINVTLFGKKQGENIVAYMHKGKDRLFRALSGTRDEAIASLKTEHKIVGWIMRAIGFLLMWIGLTLILGPIGAVLDVLPILGNIGRGIIGVITFVIALVLSLVTIIVAMIFHNLVALIIFVMLVLVLIFIVFKGKKKPNP